MATEPTARSRVVGGKEGEVFDGYALQRSCHGEQDEVKKYTDYIEAGDDIDRRWGPTWRTRVRDLFVGDSTWSRRNMGHNKMPRAKRVVPQCHDYLGRAYSSKTQIKC